MIKELQKKLDAWMRDQGDKGVRPEMEAWIIRAATGTRTMTRRRAGSRPLSEISQEVVGGM